MREIWAAHGRPDPAETFWTWTDCRVSWHALVRANQRGNRRFKSKMDLWAGLSDAARHAIMAGASGVKIPELGLHLRCEKGKIITAVALGKRKEPRHA